MKNIFILALYVCLFYVKGAAQITQPMFQTKFYVEDAVGHLDSVVIGFDPAADYLYNPNLGEVDITTPFDSVFEVRACHGDGLLSADLVLSKTIIGTCENAISFHCYVAERMRIFVKAKYQPVTFRWAKQDWYDYSICQKYSFMTTDNLVELLDINNFFELGNRRGTCLSDTGQYTVTLTSAAKSIYESVINLPPAVSGNQDSIFGVLLHWSGNDLSNDFCNQTSAIHEEDGPSQPSISLFPNPAGDHIRIVSGETPFKEVRITDQTGKLVKLLFNTGKVSFLEVDTHDFDPGFYFVEVYFDHRRSVTKKCIILR